MKIGLILVLIYISLILLTRQYINRGKKKQTENYFGDTLSRTGHPLIRLYHNKKPYLLLLDTGATNNIIDSNIIQELDKKFIREDSMEIYGINSNDKEVLETYRIRFDDQNNSFTDNFLAMDLSDTFSDVQKEMDEPVIGILGVCFLSKYALTLDFKQNTVK